jgi:hypothetical protein
VLLSAPQINGGTLALGMVWVVAQKERHVMYGSHWPSCWWALLVGPEVTTMQLNETI